MFECMCTCRHTCLAQRNTKHHWSPLFPTEPDTQEDPPFPGVSCSCNAGCRPWDRTGATHLVVLAVHDKMQRDEVIAVTGGLHVEQEAVDEVLDEAPKEHPQHEEPGEHGLGHCH